MKTKIITAPHPLLREKSKPVNPQTRKVARVVEALITTLEATKEPQGIGLSAVQIGQPLRIFIIKKGQRFVPFINPKIVWRSEKKLTEVLTEKQRYLEGCLSLPGYYGFVNRPYQVRLIWRNLEGKTKEKKFEGKLAVCVQHEYDHLDGILFTDHLLKQGGKIYQFSTPGVE